MNSIVDVLKVVSDFLPQIYGVGGMVRDDKRNRPVNDYDFTTPSTPDEVEEALRVNNPGRKLYLIGKKYGTIGTKVWVPEWNKYVIAEITTFRSEQYTYGNRKPNVEFVEDITADLMRRDFTINAMAYRWKDGRLRLIDPFDGEEDLDRHLIRAVGNPRQRFKEDPLRMLRACRFLSTLYEEGDLPWGVEHDTFIKMRERAFSILTVSRERWCMEMDKLLMGPGVAQGLHMLAESRLLSFMFPELMLQVGYDQACPYHDHELWDHTVRVVELVPFDINMRWAALFHDIAKPFCATWKSAEQKNYIHHELLGAELVDKYAHYLRWSNERRYAVRELVLGHQQDSSELKFYDDMAKMEES